METFLKLRKKFKFHKIRLTYKSLLRMSLYIFAFFFLIAFICSKFTVSTSENRFRLLAGKDYESVEKELTEYLKQNSSDVKFWRLLVDLRVEIEKFPDRFDLENIHLIHEDLNKFFLTEEEFLTFLNNAKEPSPEGLKFRYQYQKSDTYIFDKSLPQLLEVLNFLEKNYEMEELQVVASKILMIDANNQEAKKAIINSLSFEDNAEELQEKINDPSWRPFFDSRALYKYYLNQEDFGRMFYYLTLSSLEYYTWQAYLVCSIAGLGWIIFLIHLASGWFWENRQKLLIPAAVVLGILSAVFCLGVVVIQDYYLKHESFAEDSMAYNLAYCILGIGLREELCKLLFFLPLLYFLKNIRHDYKILCICSLVGLGFAIEENLSYFIRESWSPVIIGRFLTANFIHTFLTGFICYHLVKAVQNGRKAWDEFTLVCIKMIVIHGVYDFLLIDPQMDSQGMHFFAGLIYVYLAVIYLRLLINTAPPAHQFISLTRVFTFVLSLTIGITYFILSMDIGLVMAAKSIMSSMVSLAIFAYMFYREFNERIGWE